MLERMVGRHEEAPQKVSPTQGCVHAPQCAGSLVVSTHLVPQHWYPRVQVAEVAHGALQMPEPQTRVASHSVSP